jgi:CBS domain containing-hemolysin-like protein
MIEAPILLALLVLLLACSAAFSAAETALFSLEGEQVEHAGDGVQRLLREPSNLLITILLGNLFVNVAFFSFAPRVFETLDSTVLRWTLPLAAVLLFGEILPKTIAFGSPVLVARLSAIPLLWTVRTLAPARRLVRVFLDGVIRLIGESARSEHDVTPEMLDNVLTRSAEQGLLDSGEADLLAEIVELGSIRVREIMTPRVDVVFLDLEAGERETAIRRAVELKQTQIVVMRGSPDEIVGQIRVRDLLVHRQRDPREFVMPVKFVPEVASAMSLLATLRDDRAEIALVVDEWGGTAGLVSIEDVFEEIVGELRVEGEGRAKPVVPLGEGHFRVAGNLSVRDWNEAFGFNFVPNEFETVGGFVTAHLARIPRTGDRVQLGALVIEVHEVRGRRVLDVDMHVEGERLEKS